MVRSWLDTSLPPFRFGALGTIFRPEVARQAGRKVVAQSLRGLVEIMRGGPYPDLARLDFQRVEPQP